MQEPSYIELDAILASGYKVASGLAEDSPFPKGTIEMQTPHFMERGLDISHCFPGTLNLDIYPWFFKILEPDYEFEAICWVENFPAETFSFVSCSLFFGGDWYEGYIYYPHPETKVDHFQSNFVFEVIAPFISGVSYGSRIKVRVNKNKVKIIGNREFFD